MKKLNGQIMPALLVCDQTHQVQGISLIRIDLQDLIANRPALFSGQLRGLGPELERGALRIISVPYGWATGVRNWLYDRGWKPSQDVPVPVVSVGNLTLGGTGKTPCVEYLARFYRQRDLRVA